MIKIVVCDDNFADGKKMESIIKSYLSERHIVNNCIYYQNSQLLWYEIEDGERFDIIFLDIEMQNINGFDLAARVKAVLPDILIVFVSAHESYVYKSFECQPYRFVPKHKLDSMLFPVLGAAVNEISKIEKGMYLIENQQGIEKIPIRNIVYICREGKYAYITKTDKTQSKVRKTLKQVYTELPADEFIWGDRGYLCNLSHIVQIQNQKLTLSTGEQLYVSERRFSERKRQVMEYWTRGDKT